MIRTFYQCLAIDGGLWNVHETPEGKTPNCIDVFLNTTSEERRRMRHLSREPILNNIEMIV